MAMQAIDFMWTMTGVEPSDLLIMKDFVGIVYDLVKAGNGNDMLGL